MKTKEQYKNLIQEKFNPHKRISKKGLMYQYMKLGNEEGIEALEELGIKRLNNGEIAAELQHQLRSHQSGLMSCVLYATTIRNNLEGLNKMRLYSKKQIEVVGRKELELKEMHDSILERYEGKDLETMKRAIGYQW